jgi:hypothetical protein
LQISSIHLVGFLARYRLMKILQITNLVLYLREPISLDRIEY